jgi:lipoate-protein ligase A
MDKHVTRHCLQGTGTTEHYAGTMEEALERLISYHSQDCSCERDEKDVLTEDHSPKTCSLGIAQQLMEEDKIEEAQKVLEAYGDWSFEEEECDKNCPERV